MRIGSGRIPDIGRPYVSSRKLQTPSSSAWPSRARKPTTVVLQATESHGTRQLLPVVRKRREEAWFPGSASQASAVPGKAWDRGK